LRKHPRLRLDLLDRELGQDVERGELPGAVGEGMLRNGFQRRRERRVGNDQKSGHVRALSAVARLTKPRPLR
jgi:hypothetical protein